MPNLIQKLKKGASERSVLIVDDNYELASSLVRILEMFFHNCEVAHDGEKASILYKEAYKNNRPFTLVVTDLELPKKGGLALIKEIRELSKEQPILIISAHDASEFMAEAISLDVKGYILKPVSMPKLFDNLEKILYDKPLGIKEKSHLDEVTKWSTKEQLEYFLNSEKEKEKILLRIKINYLSNIYNLIGEEYADEYLKELTLLLENLNIDNEALFYRISIDELVVILKNNTLAYANILAKNMISIARYFHTSENGIIINSTISIGIAQGNKKLLEHAKVALEKSIEGGNTRVVSYTQKEYDKDLSIANGREIMQMIYKAIEENSVIPYIQPIIEKKDNTTKLYNSYVRIHQENKIYSPSTFLQIAENARQMSMITRSMIKTTFALMPKIDLEDKAIIIYLSHEDFYDESLVPYIDFWRKKYTINTSTVAFEISRIDFIENNKEFSLLTELKKQGYKFVLNNFGLQSYNFINIFKFQPDYIKIHPNVINNKDIDSIDIIDKLVQIIHLSGAKAIATHIATKEQLEFVKKTQIDYIQGYSVCKPYEVEKNEQS